MSTYLIACGGTGGHLAPGLAVAEHLRQAGHRTILLLSRKKVDSRLMAKYPDVDWRPLAGAPFGWSPPRLTSFSLTQLNALREATRLVRTEKPAAVLAFGGFMSLAATVAGKLTGCPVFLHEANRHPGKAIRLLAGMASRVYLPEGITLRGVRTSRIGYPGYPVRREIRRLPREKARQTLGLPLNGRVLAILGGSQGATALNQWVRDNLDGLTRQGISLYCVTGLNKGAEGILIPPTAASTGAQAHFVSFTDQMAEVLSAADLIVTRAGAGTIAEMVRCRTASILVPYPHAADQHQLANARHVEQRGAGILLPQENLHRLRHEVEELIFNDWLLERLRENLHLLDAPAPAEVIRKDLARLGREEIPPGVPKGPIPANHHAA